MSFATEEFNLEEYRVADSDAFYIPNFIDEVEEAYLIRKIAESPRHKWKQLANRRLQLLGGELTGKNVLFSQAMPQWIDTFPDIISRLRATGAFRSSTHDAPNHIILNEYLPGHGIMPHEDGPCYNPVVATISLNSHTVFHYYHYVDGPSRPGAPNPLSTTVLAAGGRAINPNPVLTLLLEPRSVVITQSSLYTSHLHGISDFTHDHILFENTANLPLVSPLNSPIANWALLTNQEIIRAVRGSEELRREVRYSLTCRDVEKVAVTRSKLVR